MMRRRSESLEKLIGILFLVPSSLPHGFRPLRSKPGRRKTRSVPVVDASYAICITFSFGLVISIAMQFVAGAAVSLFTDEAEVVRLGTQYMKSYVLDCMIAGIHFCCSGFFCACGLSGLSFLHNCISIVVAAHPARMARMPLFPGNTVSNGTRSADRISHLRCHLPDCIAVDCDGIRKSWL